MTISDLSDRLKSVNLSELHRQTGLPYRWLRYMASGKIKEPGFEKTTKLREYFLLQDGKRK
jgi:hypothetical protein